MNKGGVVSLDWGRWVQSARRRRRGQARGQNVGRGSGRGLQSAIGIVLRCQHRILDFRQPGASLCDQLCELGDDSRVGVPSEGFLPLDQRAFDERVYAGMADDAMEGYSDVNLLLHLTVPTGADGLRREAICLLGGQPRRLLVQIGLEGCFVGRAGELEMIAVIEQLRNSLTTGGRIMGKMVVGGWAFQAVVDPWQVLGLAAPSRTCRNWVKAGRLTAGSKFPEPTADFIPFVPRERRPSLCRPEHFRGFVPKTRFSGVLAHVSKLNFRGDYDPARKHRRRVFEVVKQSATGRFPERFVDGYRVARDWWRANDARLPGEVGGATVFVIEFADGCRYFGYTSESVFFRLGELMGGPFHYGSNDFVVEHGRRMVYLVRCVSSGMDEREARDLRNMLVSLGDDKWGGRNGTTIETAGCWLYSVAPMGLDLCRSGS